MIVDAEPIGNPSDSGQLAPTTVRVAPLLGVRPPAASATDEATPTVTLVADAGYSSANDASVRGCGDPAPHSVTCEELGFIPVFPVLRTVNPHGRRRTVPALAVVHWAFRAQVPQSAFLAL